LRERLRLRMHLVRRRTSAKARIAGLQTQWGVRCQWWEALLLSSC
jgi:hypothetical protein